VVNLDVLGPFQVVKRPLTLRPKDAKPAPGSETAGPVGWWKLDETSGLTVANAAGNTLNGKLFGKPRWTSEGVRGGALEFDTKVNWVEVADSSDLDFRNGLTVATWIKARAVGKAADALLAKGEAWRLYRAADKGDLTFALAGLETTGKSKGKPATVTYKPTIEDKQWHHVVATYDGKRLALYVDGEEKGAVTASGVISPNNVPVALGDNAASRGKLLGGWLDDVRLYTRGLTAEEVKALHREGTK
jgi:hypothetical protein